MIPYSYTQLVFFFFVYCFIGWCIETTWVSLHQKKFVNRGFMRGPFIPIYGFGAMALLLVGTPLLEWPIAVFFGGLLAASLLEYFTGMAMEAIFKVRYWDYSDKPLNINGHVCLGTSLAWGLLALLEDYFLHKPIEALSEYLTLKELNLITMAVGVYFIVDLTLSFKAAFDLRDMIIKMEKAKEELRLMQKRLDVVLAVANADAEAFVEGRKEKYEERKEKAQDIARDIEEKLDELKKRMEAAPMEYAETAKEEFAQFRERLTEHRANHFGFTAFKDMYKRGTILGNPTMASKKFKDSLDTLKGYVSEKSEKKDK